ncbi:hypothetical protein UT300003_15010 [Clostridium sardiniense]
MYKFSTKYIKNGLIRKIFTLNKLKINIYIRVKNFYKGNSTKLTYLNKKISLDFKIIKNK